jgi:phenylacetate-CoA ligase
MIYEMSVIAPCYNEEANLHKLVTRLQAAFLSANTVGEIVLVDDGSKDGTGALIDELAREHTNIVAVHHGINRGIAAGWRSGLGASHGELVCLIDADLQNLPEDVCRLHREIRLSGAHVVQGSRKSVEAPWEFRFVLSRALNVILNTCFGMRLRDNKSGFIMCRREVLADILRCRYNYRYFQSLIMIAAVAKGYTIREIETVFQRRAGGTSFISRLPVIMIFWVLIDILKALYEYRIVERRSPVLAGEL